MGSHALLLQDIGRMPPGRHNDCSMDKEGLSSSGICILCFVFWVTQFSLLLFYLRASELIPLVPFGCSFPFSAVIENIYLVEEYGRLERHIIASQRYSFHVNIDFSHLYHHLVCFLHCLS